MSTELVTINQTGPNAVALPTQQEDLTGLSGIMAKPGNIVLLQPTSQAFHGGKPGDLLDLSDNTVYEKIELIPLRTGRGRMCFPPGEFISPICRSSDGTNPSPFVEHPQNSVCGKWINGRFNPVCDKAKWTKSGDKNVPSQCSATHRMLAIVKSTGLPVFFSVKKTSVAPYEQMLSKIQKDILLKKQKGLQLALYDYTFTLVGRKAKGAAYYYFDYEDFKQVPEPGENYHFFDSFVLKYKVQAEEVEQEQASESNVNGAIDAEFVDV